MSTIKKIEETIYKKVFGFTDEDLKVLKYEQYGRYYELMWLVKTEKYAERAANKIQNYLNKTGLNEFFNTEKNQLNGDYDYSPVVCLWFKNYLYENQISEVIKICCDILKIENSDVILQGKMAAHTHNDFNDHFLIENDPVFIEDYNEKYNLCRIKYLRGGCIADISPDKLNFNNRKRKFNLPEGICWDTRNTVLNNQTWFNVVLIKNGKHTSTKTKTVYEAMKAVAKNRVEEGIWTAEEAKSYLANYKSDIEIGWTPEFAKYFAKSGPREHRQAVENKVETVLSNTSKRMYNLPKYVCYDKAESRNRERNVFQTQFRIDNKTLKNNLYTVKDAVIDVATKMLQHTDKWSLDKIADYLKTYDPEMENGVFIPSDTPKSPSVRKREKKKVIKKLKEDLNVKLAEIYKLAQENDINLNIKIS